MSSGHGPTRFELLPAVDLRGGRVVRLRGGDFARETVYGDDPLATALRLVAAGATWLHVVDLDGAREGGVRQGSAIRRIVDGVGERARCQVAGGLRDEAAVAEALDGGAARVVVGTAALRDPAFAERLVRRFGEASIVAALDIREGTAVGDGWIPGATAVPAIATLQRLAGAGVTRVVVTAIGRDGMLAGPDLELLGATVAAGAATIIASGGISTIDDLEAVRRLGCSGAIVGRAVHEGRIDLAEAIRRMRAPAAERRRS